MPRMRRSNSGPTIKGIRYSVTIFALVGIGAVVLIAIAGPSLLIANTSIPVGADRIKLENEIRGTLVQATAGTLFLLTAFFGYLQVRMTHATQATTEYATSLNRVDSDSVEARIAGLQGLQQASDRGSVPSEDIIRILEAFIDRRADPADSTVNSDPPAKAPSRDVEEAMRLFSLIRPTLDWSAITEQIGEAIRLRRSRAATLMDLDLRGLDLRYGNLQLCDIQNSNLSYGNLVGANFMGANLSAAKFAHAQLADAHFGQAYLLKAKMDSANLMNVNFTMTVMSGASFRNADLRGATFAGAYLAKCDLATDWEDDSLSSHPDPQSVDYAHRQTNQSLSLLAHHGFLSPKVLADGRSFDACDLRGADLRQADLSRAVLDGAILVSARCDSTTRWPPNFDPRTAGVIVEA
ncbi:pentapeptide repeat-containing protein [Nonomuraea sp. NPDC050451]|uniref:pentapeptide repeat-containing protein n=1 Tax=Nonomuraea sp. NPDC050451 TaxID=3364364 RepID=UPI00378834C9